MFPAFLQIRAQCIHTIKLQNRIQYDKYTEQKMANILQIMAKVFSSISQIQQINSIMLSEIQLLKAKIQQNKFICLKEFPNKYILSKSKVAHFTNNSQMFQERCCLFMEISYLLLRVEVQNNNVYVSRNILLNQFGELYYFYSFDPQHALKLAMISPGNLVFNIISFFNKIFLPNAEEIEDDQHLSIFLDASQTLIPQLDEIKQKSSGDYYYQTDGVQQRANFKYQPNNPYSILMRLEISKLFKQYNFQIKYNNAIIIRSITDPKSNSEILKTYLELINEQEYILCSIKSAHNIQIIKLSIKEYFKLLKKFLQYLQKENYIKITMSKEEMQNFIVLNQSVMCDWCFESNFRREVKINRTTSVESGSQSSGIIKQVLSKLQRERLCKIKQYLQTLATYKNKVNFALKINFDCITSFFEIDVQATSLWVIDEIYFFGFRDLWGLFINNWYSSNNNIFDSKQQAIGYFKFQLFHLNKNIGLKAKFKLNKNAYLIEEIVLLYDKVAILFLLFEKTLKNLYKVGLQITQLDERQIRQLKEPVLIENLNAKLKQALSAYQKYFQQLKVLSK